MRSFLLKIVPIVVIIFVVGTGVVLYTSSPDTIAQFVDEVRTVVGPQPVAMAEDLFYGALDRYNQWAYQDKNTPGYWQVQTNTTTNDAAPVQGTQGSTQQGDTTGQAQGTAQQGDATGQVQGTAPGGDALGQAQGSAQQGDATGQVQGTPVDIPGQVPNVQPAAGVTPALPSGLSPDTHTPGAPRAIFPPAPVSPLYPRIAAPGEGVWVPMPNLLDTSAAPLLYKTFLHPDPARSYTRVAIVAIDLTQVHLHVVAGTQEPVSTARVARTGLIPRTDWANLIAAFNGGFRAIHGHYGMMVEGQTILPPQPFGDTIALYHDGSVRIAPWTTLAATLPQMDSYRQTPPALIEQGKVNPALYDENSLVWGGTLTRSTVVWRSAIGMSADHRILYYGDGESLTARRLAEAMLAAGASDAAELDVNLSYERFLTFDPRNGNFDGVPLISAMSTKPKLYTFTAAPRDFFYLTLGPTAPNQP